MSHSIMTMNKLKYWRFIDSGPGDALYNMALDEAILKCFDPYISKPVFRIYQWENPSISIGKFQKHTHLVNSRQCRLDGIKVVRRITGGSALFHNSCDLTYSVVCPAAYFGKISIKETYRHIGSFLLAAYRNLGLKAEYPAGSSDFSFSPYCFLGREKYDILIYGKKIGGNAQKRTRDIIFQHGSVPFNLSGIEKYFTSDIICTGGRITDIHSLNKDISYYDLKNSIIDSFKKIIAEELIPDQICPKEQKTVTQLIQHRYSDLSENFSDSRNSYANCN